MAVNEQALKARQTSIPHICRPDLVGYYARRAAEYERIYQKPERQEDLSRLRELVRQTFAGMRVVEVACGTGYWTEVLAGSAASVLATDINEEVLAAARSKAIDTRRVCFSRQDAYALPAPAAAFDAGFCAFWWSHIPKARIASFLKGFHRVLAPGARVLFLDNVYVEGSSTPLSRKDDEGNTYQIRHLDDGSRHEVLKNFPRESELREAVKGLASDASVDLLTYYWVLAYTVG